MIANADLPEAPEKWRCEECGKLVLEPLRAPSPFDPDDTLHGCPHCLSAQSLTQACQVGNCTKPASGGYPRGHGYRYIWTCWDHRPKENPPPETGAG